MHVPQRVVLPFLCYVPGIKAAPEHEMVTGMALLSFFAVEKQVWVCTFWHLVLLFRQPQQHRNQAASPKFTSLMELYSKNPLFMQKKDAPVVKAAVQAFRDVLWASHVAGGLWHRHALSLCVQSIFMFHPVSGSTKYLGDVLLSPWVLWRDRTASLWQGLAGKLPNFLLGSANGSFLVLHMNIKWPGEKIFDKKKVPFE